MTPTMKIVVAVGLLGLFTVASALVGAWIRVAKRPDRRCENCLSELSPTVVRDGDLLFCSTACKKSFLSPARPGLGDA